MRLSEIIADMVANTKIMEMAFQRKEIIKRCDDLNHQICIHMIKVVGFSNSIDMNHWCNELNSCFNRIDDMNYNNFKKLSGDVYYYHLFTGYLGHGLKAMETIIKREIKVGNIDQTAKNELTYSEMYEKIEKVLHKISYDMANDCYARDIKAYI